jgi:hypothetical protein
MSTELSGKMIWKDEIAVEMVDGWTDEQINRLYDVLHYAVEGAFAEVEAQVIIENPLVRLVLE